MSSIKNFKSQYLVLFCLVGICFLTKSSAFVNETVLIRCLGVYSFLAVFFLFNGKKTSEYLRDNLRPFDIIFGLFILWELFSIIWATNKAQAFDSSLRNASVLLIYVFLRAFAPTRVNRTFPCEGIITLLTSAYLSAIIVGLFQLSETIGVNSQTVYELKYPTATKNLSSGLLLILGHFQVMTLLHGSRPLKALSTVNLILILMCIVLFASRATSVAFIAIGLSWMIFWFSKKQIRPRRAFIIGSILLSFGVAHFFGSNYLKRESFRKVVAQTSAIHSSSDPVEDENRTFQTTHERVALWEKSCQLFMTAPLIGVGTGNWSILFPTLGLNGLNRAATQPIVFKRPHNIYLEILSETGLIGLSLYFILVTYFIFSLHFESAKHRILLSALISYLSIGFFDFPREQIEYNFILALIFAMGQSSNPGWKQAGSASRIITRFIQFLSIAGIVVFSFRVQGELAYSGLREFRRSSDFQSCVTCAKKSENPFFSVDWVNFPLSWHQGCCLTMMGHHEKARLHLARAVELAPGKHQCHNDLGFCLGQLGEYEESLLHFENCLKINPTFDDARFNLAFALIQLDRGNDALQILFDIRSDTERKHLFIQKAKQSISNQNED